MTAEEFLENDVPGYEYATGELIPMSPATRRHGKISAKVIWHLSSHVYENGLGELYTAETIFQVGDRMMKPDVAFVSTARLDVDEDKAFPIPPDLAIEVISPTDVHYRIVRKAFDYLNAGTHLVWVLDPVAKTVTVYRSESDIEILTHEATLTVENIVPGFACPVGHLFE
ncbi:Uma2 family endonuclease [Candidatus Poribacteria bacterium]|nr:Uma2 family endonuclease [Candidatus Poribacteria bacterium]MYB01381.1 Uma2 family endonuclease [Candidatus Poribacteria bacterium]